MARRLIMLLTAVAGLCTLAACNARGAGVGGPTVLVAIGASDAVGVGAASPDRDNWVAQLAAHFTGSTRVVNLGISGATARQAAEQELPVALDAEPTIAVVWLGVNDLQQDVPLSQFSGSLRQIVDGLHQQTGARVFVGNLPDLATLPAFQRQDAHTLQTLTDQWNGAIAGVAAEGGATLVDIHAAWAALPDRQGLVSGDGLHPTSTGYRRIADLYWQAIRSAG